MVQAIAHIIVVVVSSHTVSTIIALFAGLTVIVTLWKYTDAFLIDVVHAGAEDPIEVREDVSYAIFGFAIFLIAAGLFAFVEYRIGIALYEDLGIPIDSDTDPYGDARMMALIAIALCGFLNVAFDYLFKRNRNPPPLPAVHEEGIMARLLHVVNPITAKVVGFLGFLSSLITIYSFHVVGHG